jgi:hypothetical protein
VGSAEGWRDHEGRRLTGRSLATLVRNEALIGNFVWGRTKHSQSIVSRGPSRGDGCVPRVIDDDTWAQMQRRTMLEVSRIQTDEEIVVNLKKALQRNPLLVTRDFRAQGLPNKVTIRRRLGSWTECLKQAGQDPTALDKAVFERGRQRRANAREFGLAMVRKLTEDGHAVAFDRRLNVLDFSDMRVRLRLLWPTFGEVGDAWRIRVERISRDVDFDLLVRMEDWLRPKDFFVVPPADVVVRFPQWLTEPIASELAQFWCRSPKDLLERIKTISARSYGPVSQS